ncbi:unnamed protein product [Lactuca virosa]|uniref:Uncharacterized protein n=1 Tax=Lactuca virosa TaxID=75947 RepID=A0AAU9LJI2_9ASTR|nr:unnamed protein product [Lactuca virosa]
MEYLDGAASFGGEWRSKTMWSVLMKQKPVMQRPTKGEEVAEEKFCSRRGKRSLIDLFGGVTGGGSAKGGSARNWACLHLFMYSVNLDVETIMVAGGIQLPFTSFLILQAIGWGTHIPSLP